MEIDRPVSTVSGSCAQRPRITGVFFGTVISGEALCLRRTDLSAGQQELVPKYQIQFALDVLCLAGKLPC